MTAPAKPPRPWTTPEEKKAYFSEIRPLTDSDLSYISRWVAKTIPREYYSKGLQLGYDIECLFAYIDFFVRTPRLKDGASVSYQYYKRYYRARHFVNVFTATDFEGFMFTDSVGGAFPALSETLSDADSYKPLLEQAAYINADSGGSGDQLDYKTALDFALDRLSERGRALAEQFLTSDFDVAPIMRDYGVSRRTAARWRQEIFAEVTSLLRINFAELAEGPASVRFDKLTRRKLGLRKAGALAYQRLYEAANELPISRVSFARKYGYDPRSLTHAFLPFARIAEAGFLLPFNVQPVPGRPKEKFYVWNKKRTFQDLLNWRTFLGASAST